MNNTASADTKPTIDVTPETTAPQSKGSFFIKSLWLLFVITGLGIGYYAWQTQLKNQTQNASSYETELETLKQDLATLKTAYQDLLSQQTSSTETLTQKVSALENKVLNTAQTATQTPSSSAYLHDILTLIALKDIYHKIETGVPFRADVKILEHTPSDIQIDVNKLKKLSARRFATLDQLVTGMRVFEDFLEARKEEDNDRSLITQIGDFLRVSRSAEGEEFVENAEVLTNAEAAIAADDVAQAVEILTAAFPKPTEDMKEWFESATSYIEGRNVRAELEGWASQLFAVTESAEG